MGTVMSSPRVRVLARGEAIVLGTAAPFADRRLQNPEGPENRDGGEQLCRQRSPPISSDYDDGEAEQHADAEKHENTGGLVRGDRRREGKEGCPPEENQSGLLEGKF